VHELDCITSWQHAWCDIKELPDTVNTFKCSWW